MCVLLEMHDVLCISGAVNSLVEPAVVVVVVVVLVVVVARYPIKFILPEFVSYLGERGVLCV